MHENNTESEINILAKETFVEPIILTVYARKFKNLCVFFLRHMIEACNYNIFLEFTSVSFKPLPYLSFFLYLEQNKILYKSINIDFEQAQQRAVISI